MYELKFTDTSKRQFSKLEKTTQQRILLALERIRIRPNYFVKKLVSNPYYRLRVGDYRIILDIKRNEMAIMIIEVGHRRNIYQH